MSVRYIKKDLFFSANSRDFSKLIKYILISHSMHLTFLIRLGQSFNGIPFIGSLMRVIIEYLIRILYSSDISCRAKIGPGLAIVHGHDIVIGADVVIGENTKIFNGVTFGNKDLDAPSMGNQPVVADNCTFCTGAKILGPVNIGNRVIVAANAVLIHDCVDDIVVGGVPAKILKRNEK